MRPAQVAVVESIWRTRWSGYALLVVCFSGILFWYFFIPSPGKAVAAMGVAAAVMTLRGKLSGFEKFLWMLALFALLFLEFRAIDKDRSEYTAEQKDVKEKENQEFDHIAGGLRSVVERGSVDFAATTSRSREVLDEITGGDSYPVVHLVAVPIDNSPNTFRLMLAIVGKNPLFDMNMIVRKGPIPPMLSLTDFVTTGGDLKPILTASSVSPTMSQVLQAKITPSLEGTTDYFVNTTARNGTFTENLHIRRMRNGEMVKKGRNVLSPWEESYELKKNGKLIKRQKWLKWMFAGAATDSR